MRKNLTNSEFIEKANFIHNNFYIYDKINYINNNIKVEIICPKHGVFKQIPRSHLSGYGCPSCGGSKKLTKEEIIAESIKKHGNKYDYSLMNVENINKKVQIICLEHGIFEQCPNEHMIGQGCPSCYGNKKLTTEDFVVKFSKIHNNKYDYSLVEYKNNRTKVKIICPEHGIFEQFPDIHKKHGCPLCAKIYTKDFVDAAIKIHGYRYDYSSVDYKNAKSKIKILCKKHGFFYQTPNTHLSFCGCPRCLESKGERIIHGYLIENKINYISQKRFIDCKYKNPLPFDFYLTGKNICIEYDGEHHFQSIKIWGGDERFKLTKLKDSIKDEYCKENNIKLIRIKFDDNILDVLQAELSI